MRVGYSQVVIEPLIFRKVGVVGSNSEMPFTNDGHLVSLVLQYLCNGGFVVR